jgi:hypothetical protein
MHLRAFAPRKALKQYAIAVGNVDHAKGQKKLLTAVMSVIRTKRNNRARSQVVSPYAPTFPGELTLTRLYVCSATGASPRGTQE